MYENKKAESLWKEFAQSGSVSKYLEYIAVKDVKKFDTDKNKIENGRAYNQRK